MMETMFVVGSILVLFFVCIIIGLHEIYEEKKLYKKIFKIRNRIKELFKTVECPYCNMKIDRGIEECPYCGSLITQ